MHAAVIDLGVLGPTPGDRDREPVPWRHSLRGWWHRRRRVVGPALVAALVLLVVAGGVAPPGTRLALLWTLPGPAAQEVVAGGGSLYATRRTAEGWTLTAYALDSGETRWSAVVAEPDGWADLALAGDMPLVTTPGSDRTRVTGYDPGTGRPRWTEVGRVLATAAGGRVLLARPPPFVWPRDDGTLPGDGRHAYDLVAVAAGTGEVAWVRRFQAGEVVLDRVPAPSLAGREELAHLVGWASNGDLTLYDLATGAAAATVATAADRGRAQLGARLGGATRVEWTVFDLGVLSSYGWSGPYLDEPDRAVIVPGPESLAAYDVATLTLRWEVSLPGRIWAVPCGPVVCAFTGPNGALEGVERSSGAVRWSLPCRAGRDPEPPEPCVLSPAAVPPGPTLLATRRVQSAGGVSQDATLAVDAATGELVAELAPWQPVSSDADQRWLLARAELVSPQAVPVHWLAWWWPGRESFRVLGTISGGECRLPSGQYLEYQHLEYLVCYDDRTTVWRIG